MKCCGKERSRGFWIKRAIFFPIAIAAGVFVFGSVVMLLWNHLLPELLGVGMITFWQAIGLLLLSRILFGGFGGGHGRHKCHCHHHHSGWMHLNPEEKEKMRSEWNERCAK
jgi:Ca2+/H+ antiporter, TMEM165/GDT1 family